MPSNSTIQPVSQLSSKGVASTPATQVIQPPHEVKSNIMLQSLPLVVLMVFFYFLMIRPQQKRAKQVNQMLEELKIGTKILTSGGIYGVVTDIDKKDGLVKIEIAKNVKIVVAKTSIVSVFKGEISIS